MMSWSKKSLWNKELEEHGHLSGQIQYVWIEKIDSSHETKFIEETTGQDKQNFWA